MPSVEIVAIGTELLLGQLVDTNTAHIAQALASNGIDVYASHAVGDNRERIAATLRGALDRADGVITSGGLGPTIDDVTKEATCDALEVEAIVDEVALRAMEERFAALVGRAMPANNRKQALLPRGAIALANPHGSAPGYIAFRGDGKFVASMPGVPSEMKPMLAERLLPWLREQFGATSFITTRVLHTMGIAESELDERIGDLFAAQENPKIAVLAHGGRCDVKLMAKTTTAEQARALIEPLEHTIRARLGNVIYGADDESLESVILRGLEESNQTLVVAESCTGGRLSAALTRIPGASRAFVGGVVAYDNSVKVQHLGLKIGDLDAYGAVSSEVAAAMATGAKERFGVSLAISVTGIAGPDGGTPEKPVGMVWFALAGDSGVMTRSVQFRGDREVVQQRATAYALGLLWKRVTQAEPNETNKT